MNAPARKLPQAPSSTTPAASIPSRWNHQKWGTLADPAHKSQISTLLGEYSCTEQFARDCRKEAAGEDRTRCSGKTEMGTATHGAIRRALTKPETRDAILGGNAKFPEDGIRKVMLDEFDKATTGREVVWYGKDRQDKILDEKVAQIIGLFADMHRHVAKVLLCEAGFIAKLGEYWTEGHQDIIYEPRGVPNGLGQGDWKSGAVKPDQLVLDHGWESGFYTNAIKVGLFVPVEVMERWQVLARENRPDLVPLDLWDSEALARATSERRAMHIVLRGLARKETAALEKGQTFDLPEGVVRFGRFPDEIRLVHMADYVPYEKASKKKVERPEDVAFWSRVTGQDLRPGDEVKTERGQQRGPAWLPVRRREDDVARLETHMRAVASWVRFGRFVPSVGEKCKRCSHKESCLNDGYQARGEEAKGLAATLAGIDGSIANDMSTDD